LDRCGFAGDLSCEDPRTTRNENYTNYLDAAKNTDNTAENTDKNMNISTNS